MVFAGWALSIVVGVDLGKVYSRRSDWKGWK